MTTDSENRVVVSGIGIISSIGNEIIEFWNNCLSGHSVVDEIPSEWRNYYESKSEYWSPLRLPEFTNYGLRRSNVLAYDPAVLIGICSSDDALECAGLNKLVVDERNGKYSIQSIDCSRAGVFVGTGLGCITSTLENHTAHLIAGMKSSIVENSWPVDVSDVARSLKSNARVSPVASLQSMANSIGATLSIRYGFTGPIETCISACAAGSAAIHRGYESIVAGRLDLALCGGSEYYGDNAGSIFMAFDKLGALAANKLQLDQANRPFDRERSGFLFSQGAACFLVLERYSRVLKGKRRPIAEIVGSYSNSDANSLAAISPVSNSFSELFEGLLDRSRLVANEIDYINAHGTSTIQNDEIESSVLVSTFGVNPVVNSTKSLLGHTIGASGAIEAAVCAMTLYSGDVHPSRNLENPISNLRFATTRRHISAMTGISHNFGFGGHNVALAMRKCPIS